MSENRGQSEVRTAVDNNEKLQLLIDSVVEHQSTETNKLLSHFEKLKTHPEMHLIATYILVRKFKYEAEISINFNSPKDYAMWKLCMDAASAKFGFCYFSQSNQKSFVKLDSRVLKRVLKFLSPLVERTTFTNFIASIDDFPDDDTSDEKLQQLIEFALEHKRNADGLLLRRLEELRMHKDKLIYASYFAVKPSDRIFTGKNFGLRCELSFSLSTSEESAIWRTCLIIALEKLNVSYFIRKGIGYSAKCYVKPRDLEVVLDHLKPLVDRTDFNEVRINGKFPEFIEKCTNVFKSGSVYHNTIDKLSDDNMVAWIDFIRALNPTIVSYVRSDFVNSDTDFLLQLANMVEAIGITDSETQPLTLPVIREILRRKCNYLEVFNDITEFSYADAEKLARFFHQFDKKVALRMPIRGEDVNIHIGEYKIEITDDHVEVEHQQMNPSIYDIFFKW